MSAGISAVTPVVYNAVFSTRRANRGAEAMEETPLYGAMNMTIAGAQVFKGAQAAHTVAKSMTPVTEAAAVSLGNVVRTASETSKFIKGTGTVLSAVSNNINPFICLTSGVKVLGAKDKKDAAAREAINLPLMFAFEGATKHILGMGEKEGLYKNIPFLKNTAEMFTNYCKNNKLFGKIPMTFAPQIAQGLIFAGMSIAGYKTGVAIGNALLGKEEDKSANGSQDAV